MFRFFTATPEHCSWLERFSHSLNLDPPQGSPLQEFPNLQGTSVSRIPSMGTPLAVRLERIFFFQVQMSQAESHISLRGLPQAPLLLTISWCTPTPVHGNTPQTGTWRPVCPPAAGASTLKSWPKQLSRISSQARDSRLPTTAGSARVPMVSGALFFVTWICLPRPCRYV